MRKLFAVGMILLLVVSMCAITISSTVVAGPSEKSVFQRPIEDFVDAQGSVGPAIFLSWVNNEFTIDSSVDYAGLDNEYIKTNSGGTIDLGTTFSGSITERKLSDGNTLVHVTLHTKNALTRAYDLTIGEYVYGSTRDEVVAGEYASLGHSKLSLTYITSEEPGEPMPDLWEMIFIGIPGTYPTSVNFVATSKGQLNSEFGVPQGTPGMVNVVIEANFNAPGMWNNHHNIPWTWPASTINVKQIGN
jgi:hypothetical protein